MYKRQEDWLTFTEVQKRCNVNLDVEAIPIADYSTKVSLALNTGENVPDVILYQTTTGENASLALNGALVPISDYSDWTPNFNARVEEMGLQDDVNQLNLQDGKRYYMPSLTAVSYTHLDVYKRQGLDRAAALAWSKAQWVITGCFPVFAS